MSDTKREKRREHFLSIKPIIKDKMVFKKLRRLNPSLRERRRYLAFKLLSEKPIRSINSLEKSIKGSYCSLFGKIDYAVANMSILRDKFNLEKQTGIIRMNNKNLDKMKFSVSAVDKIEDNKTIINIIGISGILNKAEKKFMNQDN